MPTHALDVPRIRAVTIDLDDTLWPVWPTIRHAEATLHAWLDANAPATARLARQPAAADRARRAALALHPEHTHDLGLLRRAAIGVLLREAGDDETLAAPAFDVFLDARHAVTLYDDAGAALALIAARWPLVALTNGNADVFRVGIGEHFVGAVSAATHGWPKPDPRIFEAAARAAGVPPQAVLHVGDDAQLDGAGALACGMQMAWINREARRWPPGVAGRPHAEAADLGALCAMLGLG